MARHEFLFENYLVCSVIRRRFPYGDDLIFPEATANPWTEFSVMAMEFALLKALAIGMAGHYRESFGPEHMVKLVQSFSKGFERSLEVRRSILDFVETNQLRRTENLAVMLRN
jgi:lysine-N-methylase